jgi:hypothetical protein
MLLKEFLKPRRYNPYYTFDAGLIYQIDLMSLSEIWRLLGFEKERGVKAAKGPWVLVCIDMYSKYMEAEYVGYSSAMDYIIDALREIFMKMGRPIKIQAEDEFNKLIFVNFVRIMV